MNGRSSNSGRTVVLTGMDAQHIYVASALSSGGGAVAVVLVEQPAEPLGKRISRLRRRFGYWGTLTRILVRAALVLSGEQKRRRAGLSSVLGDPEIPADVQVFKTVGVNSAETRALLQKLAPDILCVYGTAIVADDTLAIAREISLNLHTGISPRYRGADCSFWPLYQNEPEWLGATVHVCTSALDGGAILGVARAKLAAEDDLGAVFGRSVIAGAKLYRDVLQRLESGEEIAPITQDLDTGREYRAVMRDWRAELKVHLLLKAGLIRNYVERGNG